MHIRAYQETSVIVELFTRSFGRVNAVAKGAKRPKSPLRSILTPASKLSISLSGKNELKNLSSVEVSEHFNLTEGIAIHSLMYINELILKATEKEDPHQKVFDIYETLLKNLSQNRDRVVLEKLLRDFELSLLQEMGYGIDLSRDAQTNKIIDKKKFYDFILKDKKHQSKKLNFVLLKGIGKPVIDINVQKNLILKSLDVII